jgi:hypothetical protein
MSGHPTAAKAGGSVALGRIDACATDEPRGAVSHLFDVEGEGLLRSRSLRCPRQNLVHILGSTHAMFIAVVAHLRLLDSGRCWRLVPEAHPVGGPVHFPLGIAGVDSLDLHALTLRLTGQRDRALSGR